MAAKGMRNPVRPVKPLNYHSEHRKPPTGGSAQKGGWHQGRGGRRVDPASSSRLASRRVIWPPDRGGAEVRAKGEPLQ